MSVTEFRQEFLLALPSRLCQPSHAQREDVALMQNYENVSDVLVP
jgi:hypothetical protein